MAKAKILHDRISIKSDILTDENLEKVALLSPSSLILKDEEDGTVLYGVAKSDSLATFNNNGACFKDGVTVGTVDKAIMDLEADKRQSKIQTIVTATLMRINEIERQVESYLEDAEDFEGDIEFLDFENNNEEGEDE